jgi:UDP-glucose:(heptosyl)LPS alpha-1,3-glucosyltransferase
MPPSNINAIRLPTIAFSNHSRNLRFSRAMHRAAADKFDIVVGFNKMPYLDVLYCADPPITGPSTALQKLNPRIQGYRRLDLACFGDQSQTRLLLLSDHQMMQFRDKYRTSPSRMTVLPPTLERARVLGAADRASARVAMRKQLRLSESALVWLFVASYPRSKGLDRIIDALHAVPAAQCVCVGFDPTELRRGGLGRLAQKFGVTDRLMLLGRRNDVPQLIAASDLLVHPSRKDVTGTVILEALANGVPVITAEACGYASHVTRAAAGVVISGEFDNASFRSALISAQDATLRAGWQRNALAYAAREDLSSGLDRAVAEIEEAGYRKFGTPPPA